MAARARSGVVHVVRGFSVVQRPAGKVDRQVGGTSARALLLAGYRRRFDRRDDRAPGPVSADGEDRLSSSQRQSLYSEKGRTQFSLAPESDPFLLARYQPSQPMHDVEQELRILLRTGHIHPHRAAFFARYLG